MSVQPSFRTKISQIPQDAVVCIMGRFKDVDEACLHLNSVSNAKTVFGEEDFRSAILTDKTGILLYGDDFSDLVKRRHAIDICMGVGRPCVALYVEDSPVKLAKPTPVEGWNKIYRYIPYEDVILMWDSLKNSKSDKLPWEKD